MPFVPGVEVDVFLSDSWADDQNGWVANFHKALLERVHVQLGRAPEIWRDKLRLGGAQDFTTSQFCRLDRKLFAIRASHARTTAELALHRADELPHSSTVVGQLVAARSTEPVSHGTLRSSTSFNGPSAEEVNAKLSRIRRKGYGLSTIG